MSIVFNIFFFTTYIMLVIEIKSSIIINGYLVVECFILLFPICCEKIRIVAPLIKVASLYQVELVIDSSKLCLLYHRMIIWYTQYNTMYHICLLAWLSKIVACLYL